MPDVEIGLKCHAWTTRKLDVQHTLNEVLDHSQLNTLKNCDCVDPGIPTTIKTMGVNITAIACLRVLIIGIGSTIILIVVEAQGRDKCK